MESVTRATSTGEKGVKSGSGGAFRGVVGAVPGLVPACARGRRGKNT